MERERESERERDRESGGDRVRERELCDVISCVFNTWAFTLHSPTSGLLVDNAFLYNFLWHRYCALSLCKLIIEGFSTLEMYLSLLRRLS